MADTMIEGLSGTEIIQDVLDQIKRKLMYSCDLRDSDSYGLGYSGTITISLKLYGMDATPVEVEVIIPPKVAASYKRNHGGNSNPSRRKG